MNAIACEEQKSKLLCLPAEVRLQIYEYVIGHRIVHVQLEWTGICIPSGFTYSCLENERSLLDLGDSSILEYVTPFGRDFHSLIETCRQVKNEVECLPFNSYTWAFESAFTLDQWVFMKSHISSHRKGLIRRVAVPTPGPYRSSERILLGLQEVLLVGPSKPASFTIEQGQIKENWDRAIVLLKKNKASDTWMSSDA